MLRLNRRQRQVLIERVPELANFIVGSLFLGQFVSDHPFSMPLAMSSIALWFALMGFTFWLAREEQ